MERHLVTPFTDGVSGKTLFVKRGLVQVETAQRFYMAKKRKVPLVGSKEKLSAKSVG